MHWEKAYKALDKWHTKCVTLMILECVMNALHINLGGRNGLWNVFILHMHKHALPTKDQTALALKH